MWRGWRIAVHQHGRKAAQQRAPRDEVDRVEIPAVDHDVVRPRCDLTDQLAEERVHAVLHARQQPRLEERGDRLTDPFAESEHAGVRARRRRVPGHVGRQRRHRPGLQDPQLVLPVDRPLDVLRGPARIRDASRLYRDSKRLAAIDGVLWLAAGRGAPVTDDPLVTAGRPGYEPIPGAPYGGHDAGAPVSIDGICGESHTRRGRRDHLLDDHRHATVTGRLVLGRAGRAETGKASVGCLGRSSAATSRTDSYMPAYD